MPWAAAAAAAAAIGGALIQSNSAENAANKQSQSTDKAIAAQNAQMGATRADQAPYREAGRAGLSQLRLLLGIQPGSSGPVTQSYAGSLVDYSSGVPSPNAELYGSDPNYRKAWDDFATAHRVWHRTGFTKDSDVGVIEREVRARLPVAAAAPAKGQAQGPITFDENGNIIPGASATANEFGSSPLMRKFTMSDFENDPVTKASFDFGMTEGQKAVARMFGARGMGRSGAAVKAATRYATDYTGTKAGESYARFEGEKTNVFNRLAATAGIGQVSNQVTAGSGMNAANNTSNLLAAEGNARGAAAIAQGNAIGGAANQIGNNAMSQYTLDRILAKPSTTPSYTLQEGYVPGQYSTTNPQYG